MLGEQCYCSFRPEGRLAAAIGDDAVAYLDDFAQRVPCHADVKTVRAESTRLAGTSAYAAGTADEIERGMEETE
jgi:hypothetical protein